MAASDALVGEALSISPWKEALAELEVAKARIAELTQERDMTDDRPADAECDAAIEAIRMVGNPTTLARAIYRAGYAAALAKAQGPVACADCMAPAACRLVGKCARAAPPAAPVEPPAPAAVEALRELVALKDWHPTYGADHETPMGHEIAEWMRRDKAAWAAARAVLQSLPKEG